MSIADLIAYLLASMGLTVLVVWPQVGPGVWVRDRLLRPMLPRGVKEVLDCYICFSFWAGLVLAPLWWWSYRVNWIWTGPLMVPAIFWIVAQLMRNQDEQPPESPESP